MPSSTRSNKETQLLFSPDPASLERSIRKEARSSSTKNNTCASLDYAQPPLTQTLVPSTDTRSPLSTEDTHLPSTNIIHPTSIDTPSQTSIDTERRDMVVTLILVRENNGDLHDQEGHLRNAAGQRIDAQGTVIHEPDIDATWAAQPVDEAARPRTLADYNRPDQFYNNRSAIRPPAIQRGDFELKSQYYTLVGQTPYRGLSHEHPIGHLERFEDLISAIKVNGVLEDYLFCKLFKYSLAGEALHWLKQLPPDLLHPGPTSRTHSCVTSLIRHMLKTWGARMLHSRMSLQSHSEAHGSDSSLTNGIVHTMDSMKCSCSVLSSEAS